MRKLELNEKAGEKLNEIGVKTELKVVPVDIVLEMVRLGDKTNSAPIILTALSIHDNSCLVKYFNLNDIIGFGYNIDYYPTILDSLDRIRVFGSESEKAGKIMTELLEFVNHVIAKIPKTPNTEIIVTFIGESYVLDMISRLTKSTIGNYELFEDNKLSIESLSNLLSRVDNRFKFKVDDGVPYDIHKKEDYFTSKLEYVKLALNALQEREESKDIKESEEIKDTQDNAEEEIKEEIKDEDKETEEEKVDKK